MKKKSAYSTFLLFLLVIPLLWGYGLPEIILNQFDLALVSTTEGQSPGNNSTSANAKNMAGSLSMAAASTPLVGTYTINSAQPTGGTNFNSFADAAADLDAFGVGGAVLFNVSAGTYNEKLALTAIVGASATNTITFDGGDSATTTLTFVNSSDTPTVYLNGTDWVTLRNLTIENTGTSDAWGVHLSNQADHITIEKCKVVVPSTTATDVIGIVASNSLSSETSSGNNANYLTVDSCTIIGGEKGIHLQGTSATFNVGNRIMNSRFADHDDDGMEVDFQDSLLISGNLFNATASTYVGMDLDDIRNFTISENEIYSPDQAITLDDANDASNPTNNSLIVNNVLVGVTDDGLYTDAIQQTSIYHNSIIGIPAFRTNDQLQLDVRNNIFTSPTNYALDYTDPIGLADVLDYNVYHSDGTNLARVSGTNYTDLPSLQAAFTSYNVNSWEGDPIFQSSTDLHLQGAIANDVGDNSVGITVDIDGDTRPLAPSTTVDIGADEYLPPPCPQPVNAVVSNITSTSADLSWLSGGSSTWNIEWGATGFTQGAGTTVSTTTNPHTLTSLSASTTYDFYIQDDCTGSGNGVSPWSGPYEFTTTVNCPDPSLTSATTISSTAIDLVVSGPSTATSYSVEYGAPGFAQGGGTVVNGLTGPTLSVTGLSANTPYDFYVQADCGGGLGTSNWVGTVSATTFCAVQLSGTYTINSAQPTAGTNFNNFADVADELNTCGVGGAVLFNISAGTYNEKLALNTIPGASATNTITFDGGDSATTILTFVNSSDTPTVYLNGTDWVTLRNMTIENTGTSDAWGVHLSNQADHNTLEKCKVVVPTTTSTDVIGIVASNSLSSETSTGNNANYLTVDSCTIIGGEKGIHLQGIASGFNVGNRILNSRFADHDDDGVEVDFQDSLTISGNHLTATVTTYTGLDLDDVSNFTIEENEIYSPDVGLALDDANDVSNPANKSRVVNNMVVGQTDDGFDMDDVQSTSFFHNTVVGVPAISFNDQVALDIRNNIFSSPTSFALQSTDAFGVLDIVDYNVYHSDGANLAAVGGTNYADLPTLQTALSTYNVNSHEGDPVFQSATDLHLSGAIANDAGDNTVGVTVDIDGDSRPLSPSTVVDIGADEYAPPACPQPVNLNASNITDTSADFSWVTGGSGTWNVEYGPTGFAQGTGTSVNTTSNPLNVIGLAANATYDFYVQDDCNGSGNGTSSWSGPFTFTTACAPFTAPYSENFDLGIPPGIPNCWSEIDNGTDNDLRLVTSTDHGAAIPSGPNCLEFNDGDITGGDTAMIISPQFTDLPTGGNRIRFKLTLESGGTTETLIIGTMSDPARGTTFVPYDTIQTSEMSGTFQEFFINMDNTALIGTNEYIGLMHGPGSFELFIDDFFYEVIPTCLASSNPLAFNITSTGADVTWTPGDGAGWIVEYGPTGFTPGGGTKINSLNDTVSIGGLSAATGYDVYISDSCVGGAGNSMPIGPVSFNTNCNLAPVVLPFTEGFESYSGTHQVATQFCQPDVQVNFTNELAQGRLEFEAGATFYKSGSRAATLDRDAAGTVQTNFLILTLDMSNYEDSTGIIMSFSHMHHGEENHVDDRVWIRGADTANWIEVYDLFANQGTAGVYVDVVGIDAIDLSDELANAGQDFTETFQVRFGQEDSDPTTSLTGVDGRTFDDIVIEQLTCPAPTNLGVANVTPTSADLNWTSGGNMWNIEYGPMGFTQGSGTTGTTLVTGTANNPYSATGLSANTWYDFYVQDSCGANGTSFWIGPFSFKTPCFAALSGTYTIGGPAGPNNFADFDSAAVTLNGCGISGPVVFNVQPGTYTETLSLDTVSGTSSVNTITFDGGSAATTTITFSSGSDIATIYLNGTDWVTVKNMTIENTSTSDGWGVLLTNAADHNTIESCDVVMPVTTTTDIIGIVASNSISSETSSGNNANYLTIEGCTITGGEKGIHLQGGGTTNFSQHNRILNNTLADHDDDGIEVDFQDSLIISGNSFTATVTTYVGIDLDDVSNFEISENEIYSPDQAITLDDANDVAVPTVNSTIVNNMLSGTTDDGLYMDDIEYIDIFHNTIVGVPGLRLNDQVDLDIRNNILTSPTGYAIESVDLPGAGDVVDYNLYNTGGTNVARVNAIDYANLAALQTAAPTLNANSVEGDPIFAGANDLHVVGILPNDVGDNTVGVTTDIDGDARPQAPSTTVDMGADEYTPLQDDIEAVVILEPTDFSCGDSLTDVKIVVRNLGLNSATGFTVIANISGPVTASINTVYGATLNSLAQDTVTVSSFNSVVGGAFTIEGVVDMTGDQDSSNDTIVTTVSINDALAPVPTAALDSVCPGDYDTLYFPAGASNQGYEWRTTGGTVLGTADSLVVGPLGANDTTINLAATTSSFQVGPVDNTIGTGGNFTNAGVQELYFTANQTVTIDSFAVYPNGAGDVVVNLYNAGGTTPIQTTTVTVPASAAGVKTMIPVGFTVTPGNYEMDGENSTTGGLYRNDAGASYPYSVAALDITGNSFDPAYYYFFYDWHVTTGGCPKPLGSVTIYNKGAAVNASFTSTPGAPTSTDLPVTFDGSASTGATSYTWDFGDGNTGSGVNPSHNYTANGTYTVELIVDGVCGADTITNQVVIQGISISENALSRSLKVFPNPSKDFVSIRFETAGSEAVTVRLLDLSGKEVLRIDDKNSNGHFDDRISIEHLAKGVYMLEVESGDLKAHQRVMKQ